MKRKKLPLLAPCSSHPEAEAGVTFPRRAIRSDLRRTQAAALREVQEPIISVHGRDVEKTPGRAA